MKKEKNFSEFNRTCTIVQQQKVELLFILHQRSVEGEKRQKIHFFIGFFFFFKK